MNDNKRLLTAESTLKAWWAVMILFLATMIVLGLSIGYTGHTKTKSDQRWCELFSILDIPQPKSPPRTPQEARSRKITGKIHELRKEFKCITRK